MTAAAEGFYFVYVLRSESTARLYVGIARDPQRRLRQHNGELAGGAKSTRAGRPYVIARLYGPYVTRGDAQRAEHAIKALPADARLLALALGD